MILIMILIVYVFGVYYFCLAHDVKRHALQLISLMKKTMGADPEDVVKVETPYGLQMKWILPHGMPFVLHLKDKVKVRTKIKVTVTVRVGVKVRVRIRV